MDEPELISDILKGNHEQYAHLVNRYHIGLIIHCDRLLGDREEAEDVAQQAFIKAYNQLAKFDARKSRFSTWLYRIAHNAAIDHLRARKSHLPLDELSLAAPPDPSLIEAETAAEIRAAVAALPRPELRRVVEAYYWEGKRYEEIAAELNVPLNTIKSWLHRAKAQLKEKLS